MVLSYLRIAPTNFSMEYIVKKKNMKLVIASLLTAVSGSVLIATPVEAAPKRIECIRKPLVAEQHKYPLRIQKDCITPPALLALPGQYTS